MVKSLIKINYITKKKIAEMCVVLLPRVGYARVTNSGIVILKRSWWSLRRTRIPVTDIIIKYLPIYIGTLMHKKDTREVYIAMCNDKVATIVSLTKYTDKLDLLDYVYREYAKACLISEPEDLTLSYNLPIRGRVHSFNLSPIFKKMKVKEQKITIASKVEKLRKRHSINFKDFAYLFINQQVSTV
jgi:hypothetical protein